MVLCPRPHHTSLLFLSILLLFAASSLPHVHSKPVPDPKPPPPSPSPSPTASPTTDKIGRRKTDCSRCFDLGPKRAACKAIADGCDDATIQVVSRQTIEYDANNKVKVNIPKNMTQDTPSFFCRGFLERFLKRPATCQEDIGTDKAVISDGFAQDLVDQINILDPASAATATSNVVDDYQLPDASTRLLLAPWTPTLIPDGLVRYGRTTTAAKVWVTTAQDARWQIIKEAILKLSLQTSWADVFSTDTSTFTVEQVNGYTYVVYIPFASVSAEF